MSLFPTAAQQLSAQVAALLSHLPSQFQAGLEWHLQIRVPGQGTVSLRAFTPSGSTADPWLLARTGGFLIAQCTHFWNILKVAFPRLGAGIQGPATTLCRSLGSSLAVSSNLFQLLASVQLRAFPLPPRRDPARKRDCHYPVLQVIKVNDPPHGEEMMQSVSR